MLICGPSGSGKTCLLNYLATNEFWETVTSIEEKGVKLAIEPEGEKLGFRDIPGHFHFRKLTIESAERAKVIILILDSKDKDKFSEAGSFLFDLLNNHQIFDSET